MRRPSLTANRRTVDLWNLCIDPGAEVIFRPGLGQPIATRTASRAHMIGPDAFVFVMGAAGRVPLDRVTPASTGA
ncbi:hypothetical protein ACHMW5_02510 [Azospirillum melinis]|uniref:hypothetical protein n=1 Tax=Azospirillum melinis TaxID=328839 RepID=UPI003756A4C7